MQGGGARGVLRVPGLSPSSPRSDRPFCRRPDLVRGAVGGRTFGSAALVCRGEALRAQHGGCRQRPGRPTAHQGRMSSTAIWPTIVRSKTKGT